MAERGDFLLETNAKLSPFSVNFNGFNRTFLPKSCYKKVRAIKIAKETLAQNAVKNNSRSRNWLLFGIKKGAQPP